MIEQIIIYCSKYSDGTHNGRLFQYFSGKKANEEICCGMGMFWFMSSYNYADDSQQSRKRQHEFSIVEYGMSAGIQCQQEN